ncbi:MAG: hypothetical protein ABH881_03990 [bacterium]
MKFKLKHFIYFINDVTNIMLKKDYVKLESDSQVLRKSLIIVSIILGLSILLNIYLCLK